MLNPKTLEAMRVLEERILNSLLAERHGSESDPNYGAANEHADEGIALAARDLVDAINAADPQDWPVGWACGEVGTGWPNGTARDPVYTEPCRLRPDHEEPHDWAQRETAQEAEAEIAKLRAVAEAAKAWRAQFEKPADSKPPRMRALIAAVDALGRQVFPAETAGQVWTVPAEPDMERVRDRHGRVWVRSEYDKAPPMWWLGESGCAIPHTWHELLGGYGPLTEVVPAEVVNA